MQAHETNVKKVNWTKLSPDLAILVLTIVVNCLVTGLLDVEFYGCYFAPFFGGAVRGLFMRSKSTLIVAPVMLFLDIILFVPMMFEITDYGSFSDGLSVSWAVGFAMVVTSFAALGIRTIVKKIIKSRNQKWKKNFTEFINFK